MSPYAVLSLVMTNSFVAPLLRADPDNVRRISPGPPTTGEASGTMRAATANVIDRFPFVSTKVAALAPLELIPYRSTSSEVYGTVRDSVTSRPSV